MADRPPKILDADFQVIEDPGHLPAPFHREPVLKPGWPLRLFLLVLMFGIGTLFLLRANGHPPFGG